MAPERLAQAEPDRLGLRLAGARPGGARLRLLLLHRRCEARQVDRNAAALERVLGEVERKAESVVETEGDVAGQRRAGTEALGRLVEQGEPARQRPAEARLLQVQRFRDHRFGAREFRIGPAHLGDQHRHQPEHDRVAGAKQMSMAHGATHDAAQHIAAALVGGQHAVGDQEARRAQMVGDDPVTGAVLPLRLDADEIDRGLNQRPEQVDVVIVVDALQDGRDALQPHAGVDRRARQVDALAAGKLLVLHEDEVPHLDETVAVLVRAARRAAGNVLAVVVEDLRTRTARADVAHLPEVVRPGDAQDARFRQAGNLAPQVEGLIVVDIDGRRQSIRRQAELPGNQVPGQFDRLLLEIVAEGEVAEHLEEGVMPGGIADIVEVVVLAAGAHAFLRGRRPRERRLGAAGEVVLERHHAGIGEHQCRIVAWHQRARCDRRMAVLLEEAKEMGPDVVDATHDRRGL